MTITAPSSPIPTRSSPGRDRWDVINPGNDLPVLPARQPWMAEAVCKGRTTLFFGLAGERPERRVRREERARKVCESCPVLESCRTMARLNGENGFWGGESEEERAAAGFAPVSMSRRSVQQAAAAGLPRQAEAS